MATTCTEYRIEFQSRHTGIWLFFMQFDSFEIAKKTKQSVLMANPEMRLRIKQIRIIDGRINETLMKEESK